MVAPERIDEVITLVLTAMPAAENDKTPPQERQTATLAAFIAVYNGEETRALSNNRQG